MSALFPTLTKVETPTWRCRARSASPGECAALGRHGHAPARRQIRIDRSVEAHVGSVLRRPIEFGPTTRIPCPRTSHEFLLKGASGVVGLGKPAVTTTRARTPAAAQSSTARARRHAGPPRRRGRFPGEVRAEEQARSTRCGSRSGSPREAGRGSRPDERIEDPVADARAVARRADDGDGPRPKEGMERGGREDAVARLRVDDAVRARETAKSISTHSSSTFEWSEKPACRNVSSISCSRCGSWPEADEAVPGARKAPAARAGGGRVPSSGTRRPPRSDLGARFVAREIPAVAMIRARRRRAGSRSASAGCGIRRVALLLEKGLRGVRDREEAASLRLWRELEARTPASLRGPLLRWRMNASSRHGG